MGSQAALSWELHLRGCSLLWSDGSPAASDVAAGMSNPVSFKRILPQWNAREQQDEARARYQVIGSRVGATLWRDVPIVRIFPNEEYAARWTERAAGGHGVSPFKVLHAGGCTKASRHRTAGLVPVRVGSTLWP